MTVNEVERLFDYGYWANGQLLQAVAQLTPDQFTQNVAGSYGSVRNTLVHMLSAEGGCLERCGGPKRGAPLKPENFPTLESITTAWTTVERNLRAFLAGLADADLTRQIEFSVPVLSFTRTMTVGDVLQHAAVHSIHHRGQAALLVRSLGCAPGNFDMIFFEAGKGASVA